MKSFGRILIRIGIVAIVLILVAGALLAGYRRMSGRSLGLRDGARALVSLVASVTNSRSVQSASQGAYTNIIFLHHSVGGNLIEQGDLRGLFTAAGYDFWDQGYNYQGLRRPDGSLAGFTYTVPDENTDPDGLAAIFQQPVSDLPVNTFSGLLQHEVILVKSCFPNSNIDSPERVETLKQYYLAMRAAVDQHPDKVFILLTTPPLNPAETNPENAARARELAGWLASGDFTGERSNLFVFDFYQLLAESDPASPEYGMLRAAYRDGSDSHPNALANREIAPKLVAFVQQSLARYRIE